MSDVQTAPEQSPAGPRPVRVSGRATAACVVGCLLVTALLIPALLRLPTWVEYEVVLCVWWAVWLATLTWLLYTRKRLTDDHRLGSPRRWFGAPKSSVGERGGSAWEPFFWGSAFAPEGALFGCAVVIGVIVLVAGLWFLIEVAVPVVLFVLYVVTRGMLAHVVNDRHHCQGRLGRALAWGAAWATAYTAPLALVVWLVHYAHKGTP